VAGMGWHLFGLPQRGPGGEGTEPTLGGSRALGRQGERAGLREANSSLEMC
jgi:hypothetical protein